MALCSFCKADTERYEAGDVPLCSACAATQNALLNAPAAQDQIRAILMNRVLVSTARANAASEAFNAVMGQFPSGLPHPDGIQRIHNVSRALAAARKEMLEAHSRLTDFLSRGVVPEDLKAAERPDRSR